MGHNRFRSDDNAECPARLPCSIHDNDSGRPEPRTVLPLALMLGAVREREAAHAAEHLMRDGRLCVAGDHIGRLLGWAWPDRSPRLLPSPRDLSQRAGKPRWAEELVSQNS